MPVLQPADAAGGIVLESGLVDSGRGVSAIPQKKSLGAFLGVRRSIPGEFCRSGGWWHAAVDRLVAADVVYHEDPNMRDLGSYCLNRNQESRVLNALWAALSDEFPRPRGWQPRPDEVAALRLDVVIGLGFIGQEIVRLWLEDQGFPRNLPRRGPATKPGWVSRGRRGVRFKGRNQ
jgi:hypothetical protein